LGAGAPRLYTTFGGRRPSDRLSAQYPDSQSVAGNFGLFTTFGPWRSPSDADFRPGMLAVMRCPPDQQG
jgi:hypothetical protein